MFEAEAVRARVFAFTSANVPSLASGRALLAVSGGADSIATAALLCEAGVIEPRCSTAAHFNHRLRGKDAAARDRTAVVALCERFGLDLTEGAWDCPQPGEAAAREARYAFLRGAAQRLGLDAIVTGHTADDQAETVLMHAMRGAGLHGLSGMAPEATMGGVEIARPLLCATRAETRQYCHEARLAFVDDETNEDPGLFRNHVRLDLLPKDPLARDLARASLLRIANDARRVATLLDAEAAAAVIARDGARVGLSKATLREAGPAVAAHALRGALVHLLGEACDIERRHYALFVRAIDGRTGTELQLPRGIVVTVDATELLLTIGAPQALTIPQDFSANLPFAGTVGGWRLEVSPASAPNGAQRLPAAAVIRARQAGDRMRLRAGTRKLQDILVDHKVPRRDRDGVPVIALGPDVLWTPFRVAEQSVVSGEAWVVHATPVV